MLRDPRLFIALMVVLIAAPAWLQAALDWHRHGRPMAFDLFTTMPGRENLRALESRMDDGLWIGKLGRWYWTPRVDGILGRGASRVVYGDGGWLFYRPALHFVSGSGLAAPGDGHHPRMASGSHALSARARRIHHAITDFGRQLEARGKRLVFVPVPTKATVYPERVSGRADSLPEAAYNDGEVEPLLQALRDSGVEVADPLPTLLAAKAEGVEVFLPADTHWSWAGMERVARQVAARIAPPRGPEVPRAFDQHRVRLEVDGDLYRMLGYLDHYLEIDERPRPPMRFDVWQVAGTREGAPPLREGSEVLVIGDSSALVFSAPSMGLGREAGFAERLAYELDQSVDLLASPAAGSAHLQELLAAESARLAAADVVVWVMTQRNFRFGHDTWEPIELHRVSPR